MTRKAKKNQKSKEMFPKKEKQHKLGNKKAEKFKFHFAYTDGLRNSAIIYMKNILIEK